MRERNILQLIEMLVITYYIISVADYGAVNELIIIFITRNQSKTVLGIYPLHIVSAEYHLDSQLCGKW